MGEGSLLAGTGVYTRQRDVGRAEWVQCRTTVKKVAHGDCSSIFQKLKLFLLPARRTGALDR